MFYSPIGECLLTASPIASSPRRGAFAVLPVVEYEPPTRNVTQCGQSSHATQPRPTGRGLRRPGRQPDQGGTAVAVVMSPSMRQAAAFADAALRRVLEVIDRRRPAAQLRPLLAPSLVDSVLAVGRAGVGIGPGSRGAAVLRRMRLQPAGPGAAAEVFGTYSRGDRIHAIACRVERGEGARWQVVALHIG